MRLRTYWWGMILIPETNDEITMLNEIPNAEHSHESGEAVWIEECTDFNGSRNPSTIVDLPLGTALQITR